MKKRISGFNIKSLTVKGSVQVLSTPFIYKEVTLSRSIDRDKTL